MSTSPPAAAGPQEPRRDASASPRLGLYLGGGCATVFTLVAVTSLVAVLARRPAPAVATPARTSPVTTPVTPAAPTGTGAAELVDLRLFDGLARGSYHVFVGEIENPRDVPLEMPRATVSAYDTRGRVIDSCSCTSILRTLAPGEKAPCTCSIVKSRPVARYDAKLVAGNALSATPAPGLEVTDVTFTLADKVHPHQLRGRVANKGASAASRVWTIVSLYGADGKIVGMKETQITGVGIAAGTSAPFDVHIDDVFAPPESYAVKAVGYE